MPVFCRQDPWCLFPSEPQPAPRAAHLNWCQLRQKKYREKAPRVGRTETRADDAEVLK